MKINNNRQIIDKIRELGKARGLTNDAQITKAAGVSPVMLIDMKSLKTSPRLDTLDKFANALGVSVSDLIYDDSELQAKDQLSAELMAVIDDWLADNKLSLLPENRAKIFAHIYQSGCRQAELIKPLLSAMRAANSNLFTKKGR